MQQVDTPRPLAFLVAQAVIPTQFGGLNILEVLNNIGCASFPATLPPISAVCILIGGQPGKVYSTKWKIIGPENQSIAEVPGFDVPFTAQINRANLILSLRDVTKAPIISSPGKYCVELLVSGTSVGSTEFTIIKANLPNPPASAQAS